MSAFSERAARSIRKIVLWMSLCAITIAIATPLLAWRTYETDRVECLSNLRRISEALLLYAQDHNGCLMPPDYPTAHGYRTWVDISRTYLGQRGLNTCPANPAPHCIQAIHHFPFPHSYALNQRFWNVFFKGPFPLDNLELADQTALLVESGPIRGRPAGKPCESLDFYWDTAWWPQAYPSPHGGKMNVVAADGHAVTLTVAHYDSNHHNAIYGRLGGRIFNWNGGHPNGDTGSAPYE